MELLRCGLCYPTAQTAGRLYVSGLSSYVCLQLKKAYGLEQKGLKWFIYLLRPLSLHLPCHC